MSKSNSNLLNYIGHLMHDDSDLRRFVVDPITDSEGKWGLTKAERAVLRRTVAGLSNNSVNGYSIDRSLSSYRRSLRLLQNVLHHSGSKMVHSAVNTAGMYTYSVVVYYPNATASTDYTCMTNAEVAKSGGSPYAHYIHVPVTLDNSNPTVEAVLNASGISYGTDDPKVVVNSFTINGITYTAMLHQQDGTVTGCYDLSKDPNADAAFWFYSINGKANPSTSPSGSVPFGSTTLDPNDTVFWQLIAPDSTYGFHPCAPHPQNAFAKANRR